jgi:hypothetical protein
MSGFLVLLAVIAVSAGALGAAYFALYLLNKDVSRSGR